MTFDKEARPHIGGIVKRVKGRIPLKEGGDVAFDVAKFGYERRRRRGEKIDLGDWERLNRPVRKHAAWVAGFIKVCEQTRGEVEAAVSAPTMGSSVHAPVDTRRTERKGPGGRGAPEWLQALRQQTGVKNA